MMKAPPPLPEDTVRRVVRVARFDGWSVLGVAGVLALAAATMGDYVGAIAQFDQAQYALVRALGGEAASK
jgi:hypothetical protein